jgi:hypothetical protein
MCYFLYTNEYGTLKLAGATMGRVLGKRTRDEPVGIVIHICMETTQGNSLFAIFISN